MWYETLEFQELPNMPSPPGGEDEGSGVLEIWPNLTIHLIDFDDDGKHDFLGRVVVPLEDIAQSMYHCTIPRWHKVFIADKNHSQGEVLLSFQLLPIEVATSYALTVMKGSDIRRHCIAAKTLRLHDRKLTGEHAAPLFPSSACSSVSGLFVMQECCLSLEDRGSFSEDTIVRTKKEDLVRVLDRHCQAKKRPAMPR